MVRIRQGNELLVNYMFQVGVQQLHYNHEGGCHQEYTQTNKQTNKTWSTCQNTDLVHKSLSSLWHIIKIQKKIFWIVNGFQLGIYCNHFINLGNPVCCSLIHSHNLTVSQGG
jgi:hypothetical protein